MRVVTICLPDTYVTGMDKLIAKEMYPNRSEVIRIAIRDLLVEELWNQKRETQGIPLVTQIEKVASLQTRAVTE